MNLKSQYDINTQNFNKLLDKKEYENQKLLQQIEYD
jgi:hypothetical protein